VQDFGVEIKAQKTEIVAQQGDSLSLIITVKNIQERYYDWINLEVNKGNFPEEILFSSDTLFLGPGEEKNTFLNFTIKDTISIGDYLINLTVISQGAIDCGFDISDSIDITIKVIKRQLDSDNDNYPDEIDAFPYDPKEWNDTDGDNYGDNIDAYPNDPTKYEKKPDDKKENDPTWIAIITIIIIIIVIIVIVFLLMKRKKKGVVQQMQQQEIQPAQLKNAVQQDLLDQSQNQYNNLYQQPETYPHTQFDPVNQETQTQNYDFKSENQRKLP
jgi:hypothetical protein